MSITKNVYHEIPLSIGLAGLAAGSFIRTSFHDNVTFGFTDLYVQIKLQTSSGTVGDPSLLEIYLIETNDSVGSIRRYRNIIDIALEANTPYESGIWVTRITPYWGIGVFNNSSIPLSTNATDFHLTAFGVATQTADQFFFSYNASGILGYMGDATETSFPYIYDAEGSLALSNMLPVPLITALGILSFGGIATVVTPFIQVATGRISKSGIASGPSATP